MTKKILITLFVHICIVFIFTCLPVTVFADNLITTQDGIVFDKSTGTIIDYTGSATQLNVPNSIDGVDVVIIGYNAFKDCDSLEILTIPDSVIELGALMVEGSDNLHTLNLGSGISSIVSGGTGNPKTYFGTLTSCQNLTTINLSENMTSIPYKLFYYCDSINSFSVPNYITNIEWNTFAFCELLTSVYIPASVVQIHNEAFEGHNINLIIYGETGSYANTYANQNGITFIDPSAPVSGNNPTILDINASETNVTVGEVITFTIKTNNNAGKVDMYDSNMRYLSSGTISEGANPKVWMTSHVMNTAGVNKKIYFKAISENNTESASSYVEVTVNEASQTLDNPTIITPINDSDHEVNTTLDMKWDRPTNAIPDSYNLYVYKSGSEVERYIGINGNNTSLAVNSSAFQTPGDYSLVLYAIKSNYNTSHANASILVKDSSAPATGNNPTILKINASNKNVYKGESIALKIETNSDAIKVQMYDHNMKPIGSDTSSEGSSTKKWAINYIAENVGENKKIYFKAISSDGRESEIKYITITVKELETFDKLEITTPTSGTFHEMKDGLKLRWKAPSMTPERYDIYVYKKSSSGYVETKKYIELDGEYISKNISSSAFSNEGEYLIRLYANKTGYSKLEANVYFEVYSANRNDEKQIEEAKIYSFSPQEGSVVNKDENVQFDIVTNSVVTKVEMYDSNKKLLLENETPEGTTKKTWKLRHIMNTEGKDMKFYFRFFTEDDNNPKYLYKTFSVVSANSPHEEGVENSEFPKIIDITQEEGWPVDSGISLKYKIKTNSLVKKVCIYDSEKKIIGRNMSPYGENVYYWNIDVSKYESSSNIVYFKAFGEESETDYIKKTIDYNKANVPKSKQNEIRIIEPNQPYFTNESIKFEWIGTGLTNRIDLRKPNGQNVLIGFTQAKGKMTRTINRSYFSEPGKYYLYIAPRFLIGKTKSIEFNIVANRDMLHETDNFLSSDNEIGGSPTEEEASEMQNIENMKEFMIANMKKHKSNVEGLSSVIDRYLIGTWLIKSSDVLFYIAESMKGAAPGAETLISEVVKVAEISLKHDWFKQIQGQLDYQSQAIDDLIYALEYGDIGNRYDQYKTFKEEYNYVEASYDNTWETYQKLILPELPEDGLDKVKIILDKAVEHTGNLYAGQADKLLDKQKIYEQLNDLEHSRLIDLSKALIKIRDIDGLVDTFANYIPNFGNGSEIDKCTEVNKNLKVKYNMK